MNSEQIFDFFFYHQKVNAPHNFHVIEKEYVPHIRSGQNISTDDRRACRENKFASASAHFPLKPHIMVQCNRNAVLIYQTEY